MRSSSQTPDRPNSATASISSGGHVRLPIAAPTALRARQAQRRRRPPPMRMIAASAIQTADFGSREPVATGTRR